MPTSILLGDVLEQPPVVTQGDKKELRRWDLPKRSGGMNRDGFEMYPRMLYKAMEHPLNGRQEVCIPRDVISPDRTLVILNAEQFNSSCQLTVGNDQEYERARDAGWRDTQQEAMAYVRGLEEDVAEAAAHRAYTERGMGEGAKREADAAEKATHKHVAEVKEKPRGWSPERRAKQEATIAARKATESAPEA